MTPALEVRGLSAGYGPMQVVHDVSLTVGRGERVGLLGLNGHGKTTLLRAIVNLVGWRVGQVELHGRTLMGLATHAAASRGVVLIPQGDALFPGLTVRDNLDSGAYGSRSWHRRGQRRDRVLDIFPQLASRLDQPAGTLSGGERRMVSIGRGLMAEGDLYLVDEPSVGLAPILAVSMIQTLFSLELDGGGMLLAEQNRALIDGQIDRVLHLHGGRLTDGPEAGDGRPGDAGGRGATVRA